MKTIKNSAWSGPEFFGFGFDFQGGFGFGFIRVCHILPFRVRVLKFRVYGFLGLKKMSKFIVFWVTKYIKVHISILSLFWVKWSTIFWTTKRSKEKKWVKVYNFQSKSIHFDVNLWNFKVNTRFIDLLRRSLCSPASIKWTEIRTYEH